MSENEITRRRLLELGLALPPLAALAGGGLVDGAGAAVPLAPTPAIADADDDDPTPALTEGPYFTPNSPRRRSIVPAGARGTRLTLSGRVLTTSGRPVARALVDFWQCDSRGAYDNSGYRFRGHQLTDAVGRYTLFSVVPGIYPGRTRHIHVKVQAPRRPVLTTQLFFPGVAGNRSDGIYDPECLINRWRLVDGRRLGRFDFVLDIA
jgi:protocatechuate 3,4-dioxygenase beta subunit